MSGAEDPNSLPGIAWFISLGNILTVAISVSVIIGAIFQLVRYLRKNVTKEIVAFREDVSKDLRHIKDQMDSSRALTEKSIQSNAERMEEIRWLIAQIEKRIDEIRNDLGKRVDQRADEIRALVEKLDKLKEEYHRLSSEIKEAQKEIEEADSHRNKNNNNRGVDRKNLDMEENSAYW